MALVSGDFDFVRGSLALNVGADGKLTHALFQGVFRPKLPSKASLEAAGLKSELISFVGQGEEQVQINLDRSTTSFDAPFATLIAAALSEAVKKYTPGAPTGPGGVMV